MIAVDSNILVYAHRADSEWHGPAARAVAGLANSRNPWAIPWNCIAEFLSVVTNPRVYAPPTPREKACDQVEAWLASPSLVLLGEDVAYWPTLRDSVIAARIAGGAVHDARIAALCKRHGVSELWTADRDFSRFRGLNVRNPLTEPADD